MGSGGGVLKSLGGLDVSDSGIFGGRLLGRKKAVCIVAV